MTASVTLVALTTPVVPAQSVDQRLDEGDFLRGLSDLGSTSVIEEFVASHPTEDSTTRAIRSIALLRSEAMLHAPGTFERVGGLMKVVRARQA